MYINYTLSFLSLFISLSCFGQSFSEAEIYSWYDNQTGIENSSLFRGVEYVEEDRMINEKHKFFQSDEFQKGWVIYDGQLYNNVPLKFNIYNDVLMVYLQHDQKSSFFQLFSDMVDNFQIHGHKFKYLEAKNDPDIQGFYEVISENNDFKIFKKHVKDKKELRDKSVAYIEFSTANPDYVFQINEQFFDLDNRRDLFSRFPDYKKDIRDFYKDFRKQSRNQPDAFMIRLADKMNSLLLIASNDIKE
ncbi:MAG: hypothetical protein R6V36_00990 [Psychroflexus sp.]